MTATYNLVVPQATTFNFEFYVATNGVRWNLTNYTATMTIRPFIGATSTTLVATTQNGMITITGGTGTVNVNLTATQTNIAPNSYVYDFVLYSGSTVIRLLEGKFVVAGGVTV